MPDFRKQGSEKPEHYADVRHCSVDGCMAYKGHSVWVRSLAFLSFHNSRGELIELCGRHYLEGLDKVGKSVPAQLRRFPDSVYSLVEQQRARANDATANED